MSNKFAPVGFRHGVVFQLNASGRIAVDDEVTAYEGDEFAGPKAYNLASATPRDIVHTGKDNVLVQDKLPSLEADTAEILVSIQDLDMDALLSNVKNFAFGGAQMVGRMTDQRGYEPTVAMLLYQQSKDLETGLKNWHFHIIPATQCIPLAAAWGDSPTDHRYALSPTPSLKALWGIPNSVATHGATRIGIYDGIMSHKPTLFGYLGDGIVDTFAFPTAMADTNYAVIVNGVLNTTVTKTTTGLDFDSYPPALAAEINVFGGLAD